MAKAAPYELTLVDYIKEHLAAIEKKYHSLILGSIEEQLRFQPTVLTRNRKRLEEIGPFGAEWELRCGPGNRFRAFYAVSSEAREVVVVAIGVKHRNRLYIAGQEVSSW